MILSTHPSTRFALLVPLALLLAGLLGKDVGHPPLEIPKQETSINFNADLMHLASVGFNSTIADLVWVQTLMESDLDHYRGPKLDSWLYHRFELISRLDPNFYENYLYGGQYLMIVKDDLDGAEELISRGLKLFPDDMSLNWYMGFLWAYERLDVARAYPYFKKVSVHPNRPQMFDSIFARMSAQAMGAREAFAVALESWKQQPEGSQMKIRLYQVLYSLKAEIDLECLNKQLPRCELKDFEGNPYIKNNGIWTAPKPLINTRLNIRKKSSN